MSEQNKNDLEMDIDIKELFEKDFNAEDISVSEDLIARTMAAIQKEKNTSNESNDANITDISKRKKTIRLVSGLAAALFIGVIGFAIFRMGNNYKAESAKDNSIKYANTAGIRAEQSETDSFSSLPEETKESSSPDVTESAAYPAEYETAMENSISANGSNENYTVKEENYTDQEDCTADDSAKTYAGENQSIIRKNEEAGESFEDENVTVLQDLLLGLNAEIKQGISFDSSNKDVLKDIKKFNSLQAYSDLISDEQNKELLKEYIIKSFTEDGENLSEEESYNLALLLCNLSGVNFCDENGTPVWNTGSEYWKLYSETLNNEEKE